MIEALIWRGGLDEKIGNMMDIDYQPFGNLSVFIQEEVSFQLGSWQLTSFQLKERKNKRCKIYHLSVCLLDFHKEQKELRNWTTVNWKACGRCYGMENRALGGFLWWGTEHPEAGLGNQPDFISNQLKTLCQFLVLEEVAHGSKRKSYRLWQTGTNDFEEQSRGAASDPPE